MARQSPISVTEVPPKSTLFCSECEHRAPVDGDWVLDARPRGTRYQCPDCETTITVRESGTGTRAPLAPSPLWTLWGESVRTWGEFWQELFGAA